MQTSARRGQTGYMQQVKAHQAYTLFIKHSAEPKAKTDRDQWFSAPREELLSDFWKKKKKWMQSPRKQMGLWCAASVFLDLHHSDPSRTREHPDFIEIDSEEDEG